MVRAFLYDREVLVVLILGFIGLCIHFLMAAQQCSGTALVFIRLLAFQHSLLLGHLCQPLRRFSSCKIGKTRTKIGFISWHFAQSCQFKMES